MKKIMLTFMLLMSVISGAIAQNNAMYVYRNDGVINTIFREELDSMVCSRIGLDGIAHKEYVVQEIYTIDSIYRIPLNVIDSIGLVTPETKYKPGVVQLDDLRDFIISVDHMTIYLKKDIPPYLIPKIGAKLLTTEISDLFIAGFAGEVESVQTLDDRISVVCEKVSLEDIFECFYYTTKITRNNAKIRRASDNVHNWGGNLYSPGTVTLTDNHIMTPLIKRRIDDDLSFMVDYNHQVSLTPTYCGKASLIVSPTMGMVFNVELTEERKIDEDYSLSGDVDYTNDIIHKNIPVLELGIPFLWAYVDFGIFIRAKATAAAKLHFGQTYRSRLQIDISSKNFFIPQYNYTNIEVGNEYSGSFMVDGSIGFGVFGELGIEYVDKRIASAAFRCEGGLRLQGDAVLYKKDAETALHSTQLYRNLKDSKVSIIPFYKVGAQANVLIFGWDNGGFKPLTRDYPPLIEASLVPTFSNTKLENDDDIHTSLFASSDVSGHTLPQDLGFTLIEGSEEEGFSNEGITSYAAYDYHGPKTSIYSSFFETKPSESYRVYPTTKLMGIEMLAEPYADICEDPTPLVICEEAIIRRSDYTCDLKIKLLHKGKLETIEDWGYIKNYNDTISLQGTAETWIYNHNYTYNSAKPSPDLTFFIKYKNNSQIHKAIFSPSRLLPDFGINTDYSLSEGEDLINILHYSYKLSKNKDVKAAISNESAHCEIHNGRTIFDTSEFGERSDSIAIAKSDWGSDDYYFNILIDKWLTYTYDYGEYKCFVKYISSDNYSLKQNIYPNVNLTYTKEVTDSRYYNIDVKYLCSGSSFLDCDIFLLLKHGDDVISTLNPEHSPKEQHFNFYKLDPYSGKEYKIVAVFKTKDKIILEREFLISLGKIVPYGISFQIGLCDRDPYRYFYSWQTSITLELDNSAHMEGSFPYHDSYVGNWSGDENNINIKLTSVTSYSNYTETYDINLHKLDDHYWYEGTYKNTMSMVLDGQYVKCDDTGTTKMRLSSGGDNSSDWWYE